MTTLTGLDVRPLAPRRGGTRGPLPGPVGGVVPFVRTVAALSLVGVVVVGQLYTALPLLGRFGRSWTTTAGSAAWTVTAFGLGYAFGFLVSGPLSDRVGRRRVILLGLLATAGATALFAAAPSEPAGVGLRALQGLCAASFAPPALAYVADRIEPGRRVAATTWLTSSFLAAGVLGQVYAQSVAQALGWRTVYWSSALLLAGGAVLLALVLDGRPVGRATSTGAVYRAMGRLLTRPTLVLLLAATATVLCGFVALYAGLQPAGPRGIAEAPHKLLALRAGALPAMVLIPMSAALTARIDPARRVCLALTGAGAFSVVIALLDLADDLTTPVLVLLLLGFVAGIAMAVPSLVQAIGARSGTARGAGVALYTFVLFVGASLGPALASTTARHGFSAVAGCVGLLTACGAVLAGVAAHLREPGEG
jgi:MFS family permease